jgi:hypothetical protein
VQTELRGPPLANYEGWVGIDVVNLEDGYALEIDQERRAVRMQPDVRYALNLTIGPDPTARLRLPLRVSGGTEAKQVEFDVILDSDDPRLQQRQTVTVTRPDGNTQASFPLEGRWEVRTRLWLRIAQRGQFIQNVELTARAMDAS